MFISRDRLTNIERLWTQAQYTNTKNKILLSSTKQIGNVNSLLHSTKQDNSSWSVFTVKYFLAKQPNRAASSFNVLKHVMWTLVERRCFLMWTGSYSLGQQAGYESETLLPLTKVDMYLSLCWLCQRLAPDIWVFACFRDKLIVLELRVRFCSSRWILTSFQYLRTYPRAKTVHGQRKLTGTWLVLNAFNIALSCLSFCWEAISKNVITLARILERGITISPGISLTT